jgi:hypothetical protein
MILTTGTYVAPGFLWGTNNEPQACPSLTYSATSRLISAKPSTCTECSACTMQRLDFTAGGDLACPSTAVISSTYTAQSCDAVSGSLVCGAAPTLGITCGEQRRWQARMLHVVTGAGKHGNV